MTAVNNDVYRALGERWYGAADDPVALLRAEARLHAPWIAETARNELGDGPLKVLDLGCGAGFIANALAERGFDVVGVDLAPEALAVAHAHDRTGRARWQAADVRALPLPDRSFDVACAMDLLEHVTPPAAVVAEASRILRPGGLFFFHTFDRSWAAWLVVIQAVETFVRNVPPHLHVYRSFVRPAELTAACRESDLAIVDLRGCRPVFSAALVRLARSGIVPPDLAFRFSRSTLAGYSGFAKRLTRPAAPSRSGRESPP